MAIQGVEVTNVRDAAEYDRAGNLLRMKQYTYYVDRHGPFVLRVPAEPFDPYQFEREVQIFAQHLRTLGG